jgi:hypothetical protein
MMLKQHFTRTTKEIDEYVGSNYKFGSDVRQAVEQLEAPDLDLKEPEDPPEGASRTRICLWEKHVDSFAKRLEYLTENLKTLYSLVWGQCTDILRQRVEALPDFDEMHHTFDGLGLLKAVKDTVFHFQSQKYLGQSLHEAERRFYTLINTVSSIRSNTNTVWDRSLNWRIPSASMVRRS